MKKPWPIFLGIFAISLMIFFWLTRSAPLPEAGFRKESPRLGQLDITVLCTGVVQPENRLEIKPPIAGRVETILVKEGQVVKKGQILAWMSSTERAALLDAARAKGDSELRNWEELYRPTPILAPLRGTVISKNLEPGQSFTGADPVFVMSNRLTVKAQVDETDIAQIKIKQKAEIVLDAYPGKNFEGKVDQIAFDAKTVNNVTTYIVDVLPEAAPSYMRSGMTANVTFQIESKENVLLIPNEAIKVAEGKTFVLTLETQGSKKPERRFIETGLSDGKKTEVLTGLQEEDVLLVAQVKTNPNKGPKSQSAFPGTPNMRMGGGGRGH